MVAVETAVEQLGVQMEEEAREKEVAETVSVGVARGMAAEARGMAAVVTVLAAVVRALVAAVKGWVAAEMVLVGAETG